MSELPIGSNTPGNNAYTTVLGLDSRIVTYGAVYKEDIYIITMRADVVENYDSMLPKFEYMAKNVTFDK